MIGADGTERQRFDRDTRSASITILGIAALAAALAATAAAKPLAKSTFNSGTENWKVVGDTAGDREDPDHILTGGDPGAYVEIDDAAISGVMYWRAPNEFRGNKGAAYKGTLSFKLTQSPGDNQFVDDDVVLKGAGLQLVFPEFASTPGGIPVLVPIRRSAGQGLLDRRDERRARHRTGPQGRAGGPRPAPDQGGVQHRRRR